jgi:AcrR family transcriptional regulator
MQPEERREQILSVAAGIFSRKGYRKTSVADVVEGAQIGRGTFYLYFDSKKAIFIELIESYFQEFEALLRANQERLRSVVRSGGDVFATWRENLLQILEYHQENPILTSLVYGEVFARDVDFSRRVDNLIGLTIGHFQNELRLLQKAGLLRPCDPEVASAQLLGSIIYVLMVYLVRKENVDLQALADEILQYHVRALASDALGEELQAMPEQTVRVSYNH